MVLIMITFFHYKNTNNFYEIEVLEKWNQYFENVKIILDVGANIGNHSIYWSQLENVNKIISFEPVPKTLNYLTERNLIKSTKLKYIG